MQRYQHNFQKNKLRPRDINKRNKPVEERQKFKKQEAMSEKNNNDFDLLALMLLLNLGRSYRSNSADMKLILLSAAFLISSAHAIQANQAIISQTSPSIPKLPLTEKEKIDMLRADCTNNSVTPFNKPANLILGAQHGKMIPATCFNQNPCSELTTFLNFYQTRNFPTIDTFMQQREINIDSYNKWTAAVQNKLQKLSQTAVKLNSEQNQHVAQLVFILGKLKQVQGSDKIVDASGLGNCAEQINQSMKRLLLKKMEYGLTLKIQFVILNAQHPDNKNNVQDHRFLLLDSDISDINIQNDAKSVGKALDKIKSGYYCDQWNHLFENAEEITPDKRSLYTKEGHWHTMNVKTIEFDFKHVNALPKAYQQFFCNELKRLGFPADYQPSACSMWSDPASSTNDAAMPREKNVKRNEL